MPGASRSLWLELINCKVLAREADGASKNVTAMRIHSEAGTSRVPQSQAWLELKYLSVCHPVEPARRLFSWLCTTHQFKLLRNQLWTSREKGKRSFISEDGYRIRWEELWDQFNCDAKRASPRTKLREDALLLDGWAKMNVAFAKAPFHDETLYEALEHICSHADIPVPLGDEFAYASDPACLRPALESFGRPRYNRLLGMFSARLTKAKLAILVKKEALGSKFHSIMDGVATLEYRAVIHDIFVEVLMNKELHFCRENVSDVKQYLQMKMTYFAKWHAAMQQRKLVEASADITFLSSQTWANIRFAVCGFVEFAVYVLETMSKSEVVYVPMLFSNTSDLEALFSHLKSLGGTDARTYKTRVACRSVSGSIDAQKNPSSYSTSEYVLEAEIDDGRNNPKVIRALNSDMDQRKRNWLGRFDGRKSQTIAIMPEGHKKITSFSPIATAACNYLSMKMIPSHFTEAIA